MLNRRFPPTFTVLQNPKVWQVAGPSPGTVGAIFGLNAEGLAVARALHMAKARKQHGSRGSVQTTQGASLVK